MHSIDELSPTDRQLLESVLMKDIEALTPEDIAILNARRVYLNFPQRQAYKDILLSDTEVEAEATAPQEPNQQHQETAWTDPQTPDTQEEEELHIPDEAKGDVPGLDEAKAEDETAGEQTEQTEQTEAAAQTEQTQESTDQAATPAENPYDVDPSQLA